VTSIYRTLFKSARADVLGAGRSRLAIALFAQCRLEEHSTVKEIDDGN
jgi:hypothetical protein